MEHFTKETRHPATGIPEFQDRVRLTLDRPEVKVDGWTFVGTLSWDADAGLITRIAEGKTLNSRPEARRCDVCKSSRDRKNTYIVQDDSGAEQQVGSNCLVQFLGIRPNSLWMLDYDPAFNDSEGDDDDGARGYGSASETRVGTLFALAATLAVVDSKGWLSKKGADAYAEASGEGGRRKVPTSEYVMDVLGGSLDKDPVYQAWLSGIRASIEDHLEDASALRDYARTIDGESEYAQNMRALAGADTATYRNLPLLISATGSRLAQQERAKRDEVLSTSAHVGVVPDKAAGRKGTKLTGLAARVATVRHMESDWGMKTLLTFVTEDGNVLKWWASSVQEYEVGDAVTLAATVKKHDEFRGVKETIIERAKVTLADGVAEQRAAALTERDAARDREREAERVAAEARRNPAPEGYDLFDPKGSVVLPVGAVVRVKDGFEYQDVTVAEVAMTGQPQPVHVAYAVTSDGMASDAVFASQIKGVRSAGPNEESLRVARIAFQNTATPLAYMRVADGVLDRVDVGSAVRIINPTQESGTYTGATFLGLADGRAQVRLVDGTEVSIPPRSIVAVKPDNAPAAGAAGAAVVEVEEVEPDPFTDLPAVRADGLESGMVVQRRSEDPPRVVKAADVGAFPDLMYVRYADGSTEVVPADTGFRVSAEAPAAGSEVTWGALRGGEVVKIRSEPEPVTVLRTKTVLRQVGSTQLPSDVTVFYQRADGSKGNAKAGAGTKAEVVASGVSGGEGDMDANGVYGTAMTNAVAATAPSNSAASLGNLEEATPAAIDTMLEQLMLAEMKAQQDVDRNGLYVIGDAGGRAKGEQTYGRDRDKPLLTVEEAVALLETRLADGAITPGYRARSVEERLERLAQAIAQMQAEQEESDLLEAEFTRRGGWTRAFLVLNTNGHIHRWRQCATTFPRTRWGWLPQVSGHSEDEIVAGAGSDACTVCYPSAPVDRAGPRTLLHSSEDDKAAARAERDRVRAEKEAKKAAKAIANPDGSPLQIFDYRLPARQVTLRSGVVENRPAQDRFEALDTLLKAKSWLTDSQEHWTNKRDEDVQRVAEALAARNGTTAAQEIEAAQKRAAKRR